MPFYAIIFVVSLTSGSAVAAPSTHFTSHFAQPTVDFLLDKSALVELAAARGETVASFDGNLDDTASPAPAQENSFSGQLLISNHKTPVFTSCPFFIERRVDLWLSVNTPISCVHASRINIISLLWIKRVILMMS